MVEGRRQWSMGQEGEPSAKAALREQRDGADVKHDTASERENDELYDYEAGNLIIRG